MKTYGIILAGGVGSRLGYDIPKQFVKIAGKTVLEHTLDVFENYPYIDEVIIVSNPVYRDRVEEIVIDRKYSKVTKILGGGKTRQESSYIGLSAIDEEDSFVIIHDAVRPFLSYRILDDCIEALKRYNAVDVAIPSADTIIAITDDRTIDYIPPRKYMWRGQTPQCFRLSVIKKAHEMAIKDGFVGTDDCGLVVKYKLGDVYVVQGDRRNIKITYPEDVFLADKMFIIKGDDTSHNILLSKDELSKRLSGRVLVVFGASKGIGKSIVEMARDIGMKVYGYSRSLTNTDVTKEDSVEEALRDVWTKENRIDYVVDTAGVLRMGLIEKMNYEQILRQIEINYLGVVNVVRRSIPYLRRSGGGQIITFASSSYTRGRPLYSIYSSTKAAVVNLVQAVSEEVIGDNIRINVISPERTKTPMRIENFGYEPDETLLKPEQVARYTLGVLTTNYTGLVFEVRRDMFK